MTKNYSKNNITQFKYFYYYVTTNVLKQVGVTAFKNSNARVLVFGANKVRIIGEVTRQRIRKCLAPLIPQGIFSTFNEIRNILETINVIVARLQGLNKRIILSFSKLSLEIIQLYNSDSVSGAQIINILLSLFIFKEELNPQGFDSLMLAGLSTFLPPSIFEVIKRAQFLSNTKICDDPSILYTILNTLLDVLNQLLSVIPGAEYITTHLRSVSNFFFIGKHHILLRYVQKILIEAEDSRVFLAQSFREKCVLLDKRLNEDMSVLDWARRSPTISSILTKWRRHMKLVESYGNPYRQEPSCFIFEGPPGRMKSVVLNNIVQALGEPCYSHIVKAVDNGKDFYDNYNNEPIFYMDDLGQEGVSQWRTLMNMVSSVKLPLDCAEASLKDTKFFNSDKIFITTNRFQNICGLTKNDCIDDIKALHRRGYVFDFQHVLRDGDFLSGTIFFKYYDIYAEKFLQDFPPEFKKISKIEPSFAIKRGDSRCALVAWFISIIRTFEFIKKSHLANNVLTNSEVDIINQTVDQQISGLKSQGLISWLMNEDIKDNDLPVSIQDDVYKTVDKIRNSLGLYGPGFIEDIFSFVKGIYSSDYWWETMTLAMRNFCETLSEKISKFFSDTALSSQCLRVAASVLVGFTIGALSFWFNSSKFKSNCSKIEQLEAQSKFKYDISNVHSSIPFLESKIYDIDIISQGKFSQCLSLVSGHCIIVPAHLAFSEKINIVIYKDRAHNHRLVDGDIANRLYCNNVEDVAIYALPRSFPTPFKKVSHLIKESSGGNRSGFLITRGGWFPLGKFSTDLSVKVKKYKQIRPDGTVFVGDLDHVNYTVYDYQKQGFCGSLVYNVEGGILGMHVAGDSINDQGVAILWSEKTRREIKSIFDSYYGCELPFEIKPWERDNVSVVKLDGDVYANVPSATEFGPSPLFGIYPVTRSPANLTFSGYHTVKDIAKKSFAPCGIVHQREIEFGQRVLRSILADFGDLTEEEIVVGNQWLAGLNKKSSNGYKCEKDKEFFVDFEMGVLTPTCRERLKDLEEKLDQYNFQWEQLAWVETLKDELRNEEKEGEPRSFRVGTIYNQILTKKYFGNMVSHIIQNRSFNQIMVGCNPIKEWPEIYERLNSGKVFAGDIKKWDGNMPGQVQRAVLDVLLEKYKGVHKVAASVVLESIIHSCLIVQDDLFLTTHSMSSGSFLTAILNSLVNKFYTAMWYFRELSNNGLKPTVGGFWEDIDDFVYGDDKLNVVRNNTNFLNALTMREFFQSLGMDFTDASKQQIDKPFQSITEVSFLKRSFVWHNILQRIVCPLDLRTLFSGLSYVSYDKDIAIVMRDKIHAFQREIYLHPNRQELLEDFISRMNKRNYKFDVLTFEYLQELYLDPNYELPYNWGGVKYN